MTKHGMNVLTVDTGDLGLLPTGVQILVPPLLTELNPDSGAIQKFVLNVKNLFKFVL